MVFESDVTTWVHFRGSKVTIFLKKLLYCIPESVGFDGAERELSFPFYTSRCFSIKPNTSLIVLYIVTSFTQSIHSTKHPKTISLSLQRIHGAEVAEQPDSPQKVLEGRRAYPLSAKKLDIW